MNQSHNEGIDMDVSKARLRAHAHGVIAVCMAARGHAPWARFHERKKHEAIADLMAGERRGFLDGDYEIAS